jgi:hypothetical protein
MKELLEPEEIEFILDLYRPNTANNHAQQGTTKKPKVSNTQTMQAEALARSA